MTTDSTKIKSRERRKFKIAIAVLGAIFFIVKWQLNENAAYVIFATILMFVVFIEIISYSQTFLELNKDVLKVEQKGILNFINEEYEIELNDIQSTFYEKKLYDNWALYHRFFWELFFSSGQSFLVINRTNGKTVKIPFDGNESELMQLKNKLPDRVPNY